MKYTIARTCLLLGIVSSLFSCAQEEALREESVLPKISDSRDISTKDLDKWIYEAFTKPYNIEVIYQWDRLAVGIDSYTYPPREEKVIPLLKSVKALWLDVYEQTTGFSKSHLMGKIPLRIYLFGGKGLDRFGFELLTSPKSSALELYLYDINDFDTTNPDRVYALSRSLHHQFIRRLTDLIPYDRDAFYRISENSYPDSTEELVKVMQQDKTLTQRFGLRPYANTRGFTTAYAMLSPEADFIETISSYICHTPSEMSDAIKRAGTATIDPNDPIISQKRQEHAKLAKDRLTRKLAFVERYFSQSLGTSIRELQLNNLSAIRRHTK